MVQTLPDAEPKTAECKYIFYDLAKHLTLRKQWGINTLDSNPDGFRCSFAHTVLPSFSLVTVQAGRRTTMIIWELLQHGFQATSDKIK